LINVGQVNLVTVDRLRLRDTRIPNYFLNPSLCVEPYLPSDIAGRQLIPSNQDRLKNYEYTSSIFDRVFPDVCGGLNRLHDTAHSNRYWRIICGLWLSYFIDICYERFSAISRALLDPVLTTTRIVSQNADELCSNGCVNFLDLYESDHWNHHLYGLIIEHFKFAQIEFIPNDSVFTDPSVDIPKTKTHSNKEKIQHLANRLVGRSKFALVATYLPRRYEWMINLKHGQIPLHWPPINHQSLPFNIHQRERFELQTNSGDGFEKFIRKTLPLQMPKTIVEEYRPLLSAVDDANLPDSPKVIFTANKHASSDSFAVWSATQVEHGAQLLISQHGGLYGEGLVPTRHESHEIAVSDHFVSWGWHDPLHRNVLPGFALINAGVKERHAGRHTDLLLIVTDSIYPYSRLSWSTLDINSSYVKYVADFLANIDSEIRDHVLLRMHHDVKRFSHCDFTSWLSKVSPTQVDNGLSSIQKLYEKSRVVVCTTIGTTYRETFARNIPTLLLISEDVYPIRPSSQINFQKLADCRILHTSPESASEFLSEIFADPAKWWFSERVQTARKEFLDQHGRISAKPIAEFDSLLNSDPSTELT